MMKCGMYALIPILMTSLLQAVDSGTIEGAVTGTFSGPAGITIHPVGGNNAYVPNSTNNSVSVVDLATNAMIGVIDTTDYSFVAPFQLVFTPGNSYTKAYVNNLSGTTITVVDMTNPAAPVAINSINIPEGSYANFMGVLGDKVYVLCGNNIIQVLDSTNDTFGAAVEDPSSLINSPQQIVFSADGLYAYVTNAGSNTVSIIDINANTVVGNVFYPSGSFNQPQAIAVNPQKPTQAYVVDNTGLTVNVLTLSGISTQVTATITSPSPASSISVAFTPDGTTAFVTTSYSIAVINAGNNTFASPETVSDPSNLINGLFLFGLAIAPDGTRGYVSTVYPTSGVYYFSINGSSTPILPPSSFSGSRRSNVFLTQTDFINVLTWTAPTSTTPVSYGIYRDAALTELVANVSASGLLEYSQHNCNPARTYTYYIVSINADGDVSTPISTTIQ